MQRLKRLAAIWALSLGWGLVWAFTLWAQEPLPPGAAERPERAIGSAGDDLRYLHGPGGRLIPVPDKAAYDEFLEWLESKSHPGPPRAAMTRLRLEGKSLDDRVELVARFEIVVNVADEWVRVPLGMSEAQMTNAAEYTGEGEQCPAPFDPASGISWWLRGKGKHELTVPLSVPLRLKSPQRRLQLTLPAAAISSCGLRVEAARVTAKAVDRARVTTRTLDGSSEIEVAGLDSRLDLTWQVLPAVSTLPPLLEVNTAINLTLVEVEGAAVEATQRIQTLGLQGGFERIQVRLPAGTELLRLEGPDYLDHKVVDGFPDKLDIQLKKPGPGPFELRYTLHAAFPRAGATFVLDGFDVEAASVQSGYVAVTVVGDLRAMREADDERFVHRVNISDLPSSLRQPQTSLAFQFFKRLKLPLRFEPVAPLASVEPETTLAARPGLIELISIQRLQIRRGSLGRLTVRWPNWKAAGWTLPSFDLVGGGDFRVVDSTDAATDDLHLEFSEPLTGNVTLRVRSQRVLADPADQLTTSLPACDVPIAHPAVVAVYSSEDLHIDLEPDAGSVVRPASGSGRQPPTEASGLMRRSEQVFEPVAGRLQVTAERREQQRSASARVDIRLDDKVALVTQRLDIDVAFSPLEEVRLIVPAVLSETPVELILGEDTPVTNKPDRRTGEWVIPVTPPRTGRLSLTARYALELPVTTDRDSLTSLPVPLLACQTAEVQSAQLTLQDSAGAPVTALGGDWNRQLGPAGTPVWIHDGPVELVSVSLPDAAMRRALEVIPRSWVRTILGNDGSLRMRVQYRVGARLRDLPFRLPVGWRPAAAWWGRQPVVPRLPGGAENTDGEWLLLAPALGNDTPVSLITVDIEAPLTEVTSLGTHLRLATPQLPPDRLPAETVWQVVVPDDQHLIQKPEILAPAYRWLRRGFVWKRQPQFSDSELQAWVGNVPGLPPFDPDGEVNTYLFRTTRGSPLIDLRFMNQLPLLFAGAGGTLLTGLLLLRVRRLRSLPTFVAAAALISVMSIGWTELVLTLLQPTVVGAGLLLFYIVLDSVAQKSHPVEPPGPPLLPGTASTVAPSLPPASGLPDLTTPRTVAPFSGGAAVASETGSRP